MKNNHIMQTEKDGAVLETVRDAFRMAFSAVGSDRVVQRSLSHLTGRNDITAACLGQRSMQTGCMAG